MFELYYKNQCLLSMSDINKFLEILDYIFVESMCIGYIQVVIDNEVIDKDIRFIKDYFVIRNKLVEYRINNKQK